jgi:hypothetical protein
MNAQIAHMLRLMPIANGVNPRSCMNNCNFISASMPEPILTGISPGLSIAR